MVNRAESREQSTVTCLMADDSDNLMSLAKSDGWNFLLPETSQLMDEKSASDGLTNRC